jgi:hypothetical protein
MISTAPIAMTNGKSGYQFRRLTKQWCVIVARH